MTVGSTITQQYFSDELSAVARCYRDLAARAVNLRSLANGQGATGLQNLGFSQADAATYLAQVDYVGTLADVHNGIAAVTPPFNFGNQLAPDWGPG